MLTIRRAEDRGQFDHGWLRTSHTFSFADYHAPEHMRFRGLRVINEDWVAPGRGFDMHPHRDMEIVTFVLSGSLEHQDSMGHRQVIHAGEFQRMTAGTGILHSEFNPSNQEPVHLYQIWIMPEKKGLVPGYQQTSFVKRTPNEWHVIASRQDEQGALNIHADAEIRVADLDQGCNITWPIPSGRHAWLQVVHGSLSVNGMELQAGDGLAVSDESMLKLSAIDASQVILFDLA